MLVERKEKKKRKLIKQERERGLERKENQRKQKVM